MRSSKHNTYLTSTHLCLQHTPSPSPHSQSTPVHSACARRPWMRSDFNSLGRSCGDRGTVHVSRVVSIWFLTRVVGFDLVASARDFYRGQACAHRVFHLAFVDQAEEKSPRGLRRGTRLSILPRQRQLQGGTVSGKLPHLWRAQACLCGRAREAQRANLRAARRALR